VRWSKNATSRSWCECTLSLFLLLAFSFTRLEWSALITTPLNHTSRCWATRKLFSHPNSCNSVINLDLFTPDASDSFACHTIFLFFSLHLFRVSVYSIFLVGNPQRLSPCAVCFNFAAHLSPPWSDYNLFTLPLTPTFSLSLFLSSHTHTHILTPILFSRQRLQLKRVTRITIMSERVYFSSTVRHPELQHFGGQEGQEHQGKPILMSGITLSLSSLSHTHTYTPTTYSARSLLSHFYICGKAFCALACDFPSVGPAPIAAPRSTFAEALNLRFRSTLFLLD
jgi:hypothetical protein